MTALTENQHWALELFGASPLKQRKWRKLIQLLPPCDGLRCLDIGSDNGVISLLLRRRGGEWHSADLIPETVDAIRALVTDRVAQISDRETPYATSQFNLVAIIDFLEHIHNDRAFIEELTRITAPHATLIINVPNPRPGPMRRLRFWLGQTDEAHGHVRPGYSAEDLRTLLAPHFLVEEVHEYGGVWSELCDAVITAALDLLKPGGRGKKGSVVTGGDLNRMKKSFRLYRFIAPFMSAMVRCDEILPHGSRTMLIARATKRSA